MPVIESQLAPGSEEFAGNRAAMLVAIEQVGELEQNLLNKAAEAKAWFDKRGQLLPRERLNLLLDPGAPFLELAGLAGYKLHDADALHVHIGPSACSSACRYGSATR